MKIQQNLKKTKEMTEKIQKNIRNRELSDYLISGIRYNLDVFF